MRGGGVTRQQKKYQESMISGKLREKAFKEMRSGQQSHKQLRDLIRQEHKSVH